MDHQILKKLINTKKNKLKSLNNLDHQVFNKSIFIREVQKKIVAEYRKGDPMKCPIHLCIGQELPSVIFNFFLKKSISNIFCHHRSHAYYLTQTNFDTDKLFSEIMGRETGPNKGFAGSQDISDMNKNFYAGAIITGSLGIAIGDAINNKLTKNKKITLCIFGEGAAHQGLFWEAINYSVVNSLPIIFICENNLYATYSNFKSNFKTKNLSEIVKGYKCATTVTSTFDYIELKKAIIKSFNHSKKKGPFFLEILTYRLSPHVGPESDIDKKYRSENEIKFWIKNDLINIYERKFNIRYKKILNKIKGKIDVSFLKSKNQKFYKIENWEKQNFSDTYHSLNKKIMIKKIKKSKIKSQKFSIPEPY
tara:strand:+ start:4619 stop:5710 length:1092 start_codon:yes stop_codon:yes gene_type:complete